MNGTYNALINWMFVCSYIDMILYELAVNINVYESSSGNAT